MMRFRIVGKNGVWAHKPVGAVETIKQSPQEAVDYVRNKYKLEVETVYIFSKRRNDYVLCSHSRWK